MWVQRHLFPPLAGRLADELAPRAEVLAAPLHELEALDTPPDLEFLRTRLVEVTGGTLAIVAAFVEAARSSGEPFGLYRALRRFGQVQEALYPLVPLFDPVNRWFLEPERRGDDALVDRLRAGALRDEDAQVGVLHAQNERDTRGGFSLYVPETLDRGTPLPLVVALHGGHGHGRDFLWSWLREARERAIVVSPTSGQRTWSIMGGHDVDAYPLHRIVDAVAARYPVDRGRVLLTGVSDGATYALLHGLGQDTPFTHLAPACGVLHPGLLDGGGLARARGRPIYLVHGALDWMFPVQAARAARQALEAAGAQVVFRELDDLSHTYPRDENPKILDWLSDVARPRSA